jgi:hypothetical protein
MRDCFSWVYIDAYPTRYCCTVGKVSLCVIIKTSRSRTCANDIFANDAVDIVVLTTRTMINAFI